LGDLLLVLRYDAPSPQGCEGDVRENAKRHDLGDSFTEHDVMSAQPSVTHRRAASRRAGASRNDGSPPRSHGAVLLSNIMQPNEELGMNTSRRLSAW
jgi:hypothetical protein